MTGFCYHVEQSEGTVIVSIQSKSVSLSKIANLFDKEINMIVKKTFSRILSVAAVFVFCLVILAARCEGCFSIVVGK